MPPLSARWTPCMAGFSDSVTNNDKLGGSPGVAGRAPALDFRGSAGPTAQADDYAFAWRAYGRQEPETSRSERDRGYRSERGPEFRRAGAARRSDRRQKSGDVHERRRTHLPEVVSDVPSARLHR